jgi:hypothetical protein
VSTRIPLSQIRVAGPCSQPWQEMTGDDRARFCTHCDRHVHNLSAMTQDEAQRLICESAGRLCIAYVPNADGSPQTLGYQVPPKRRRFGWMFAAVVGGIGAVAAAIAQHAVADRPAPPVAGMMLGTPPAVAGEMMIMGDIGPPATRPTVSPDVALDAPL